MSRPTAAQLLTRLREVYAERDGKPLSEEKLAGRLPITLSTFNRWKKRDTKAFADIVGMLDDAGWLNPERAGQAQAPAKAETPAQILARLEALQKQVEELPTATDMKRLGESMRRAIARANQASAGTPRASSGKDAS